MQKLIETARDPRLIIAPIRQRKIYHGGYIWHPEPTWSTSYADFAKTQRNLYDSSLMRSGPWQTTSDNLSYTLTEDQELRGWAFAQLYQSSFHICHLHIMLNNFPKWREAFAALLEALFGGMQADQIQIFCYSGQTLPWGQSTELMIIKADKLIKHPSISLTSTDWQATEDHKIQRTKQEDFHYLASTSGCPRCGRL